MARDARVNDRPSCALPTIRTAESATQREHLLERTNVSEIGETIVSVRDCDKMRTADAAGTSRNGGGDRFETFDLGYAVAPIPTHRTFEQRAFRLFRFFLWKSRRRVTGQRRRVRAGWPVFILRRVKDADCLQIRRRRKTRPFRTICIPRTFPVIIVIIITTQRRALLIIVTS